MGRLWKASLAVNDGRRARCCAWIFAARWPACAAMNALSCWFVRRARSSITRRCEAMCRISSGGGVVSIVDECYDQMPDGELTVLMSVKFTNDENKVKMEDVHYEKATRSRIPDWTKAYCKSLQHSCSGPLGVPGQTPSYLATAKGATKPAYLQLGRLTRPMQSERVDNSVYPHPCQATSTSAMNAAPMSDSSFGGEYVCDLLIAEAEVYCRISLAQLD